jgi:hypothetical protein
VIAKFESRRSLLAEADNIIVTRLHLSDFGEV